MHSVLANHATYALLSLSLLAVAPTVRGQTMPTTPAAPAMSGHASADAAQMLVNFITSVNRDEVVASTLAMTKATKADVRSYASRMVTDYTGAMATWADKVPNLSLTIPDSIKSPPSSPKAMAGSAAMADGMSEVRDTTSLLRGGTTAAMIHTTNVAALDDLKAASGAAFDSLYIAAQIKSHEAVLKEIAGQETSYRDMRTLLGDFRSMVEQHLAEARKLQP